MKAVTPLVFVLLLASCSDSREPPLEANGASIGGVAVSTVPSKVPDGANPISRADLAPESWYAVIANQSPREARFLIALDHRYFGAMSFQNKEEWEYLMRAGFPSPEEWLAAQDMTDRELRGAADSGDRKAAGMFADRMARRLAELMALQKQQPESVSDTDKVLVAGMAINYASMAGEGSRGTFGVYMEGMVKSQIYGSPEALTAAMIEASRRGDPRVPRLIQVMAARHPAQNVETIYGLMQGFEAR